MPRTRTDAANRRLIERWRTGLASTPPAAPKLSTVPSRDFVEIVPAELATTPAAAPPSRELHIEIALPCGAVVGSVRQVAHIQKRGISFDLPAVLGRSPEA